MASIGSLGKSYAHIYDEGESHLEGIWVTRSH